MRTILYPDAIHTNIKIEVENFHKDVVQEVAKTVVENRVVVVGMKYNYAVYVVRKALKKVSIELTYLEYGNYISQWRTRVTLKMWTGWPTFQMVFTNHALIGGSKDLLVL